MAATLKIYTMTHCPTCEATRRNAAAIAERWPEVEVQLISLDAPGVTIPPQVFSVPTYLLNGDVISLGNPYLSQIESHLRPLLAS